jgi:hypothetical protein
MLSLPLGARGGHGFLQTDAAGVLHATLQPPVPPAALAADLGSPELPATPAATAAPAPAASVEATAAQPAGTIPVSATYFKASQLTEIPRPLSEPRLEPLERLLGSAGGMRMTLYIDEWGQVTAIDVQSATLPQPVVAQAAAIFSNVRFSPGRIGSFAVKSQIGIELGAAPAAQQSYSN